MKDFIKATKVNFKFDDCYLEHSEHKLVMHDKFMIDKFMINTRTFAAAFICRRNELFRWSGIRSLGDGRNMSKRFSAPSGLTISCFSLSGRVSLLTNYRQTFRWIRGNLDQTENSDSLRKIVPRKASLAVSQIRARSLEKYNSRQQSQTLLRRLTIDLDDLIYDRNA